MPANHVVLTFSGDKSAKKLTIPRCLTSLQQRGYTVYFAKSSAHLDIDTPKKDSYELFAAGLDFAMLVTDKQRYLKSQHDVSHYLPIPPNTDWVVQDGDVYPADIRLTITPNDRIITECGRQFPLQPLTAFIDWLEHYDRQNPTND